MIAHALNNAFALLIATGRLDPIADAMRAHPDACLAVAAALVAAGLTTVHGTARDPVRNGANIFTASCDRCYVSP